MRPHAVLADCLSSTVKGNITNVMASFHRGGMKIRRAILDELIQLPGRWHHIEQPVNASLVLQGGKDTGGRKGLSVAGRQLSTKPAPAQISRKLDDIPLAFARVLSE